MKLFTKIIERKLIANFKATEEAEGADLNHKPVVKLFDPYGGATWLLSELEPDSGNAFGLCDLGMGCPELGYVNIDEIKSLSFCGRPRIERDKSWDAEGHSLSEYASKAREKGVIASYI